MPHPRVHEGARPLNSNGMSPVLEPAVTGACTAIQTSWGFYAEDSLKLTKSKEVKPTRKQVRDALHEVASGGEIRKWETPTFASPIYLPVVYSVNNLSVLYM